MRLTISLIITLAATFSIRAQQVSIIPQPVSVKQPKIAARFPITAATQIVLEGSNLEKTASYLNEYLFQFYKLKLKIVKKTISKNVIRLNYERMDGPIEGAYNMTVDNNGVYIAGDNEKGVFYGIQTLIQLLPIEPGKLTIPYISIEDAPRFEYRGMHLDVARHFFPVAFVKKYIDYLAYHKFNEFHWHLTEDQGWRIQIKKYPKLTSVGGYRNGTIIGRYPGTGSDNTPYGGFYTQAQIKEVINYAKSRYIDVIPEIEMPGHGSAAIAAYPWLSCFPDKPTAIPANMISKKSVTEQAAGKVKLVQETWGVFDDVFCAGKDSTFLFLQNVLDEVITLFPSKYVHVGGDECPKTHWKICPHCQKRMKDLGLKDEHELQSYFIQRIEKYLNAKGKTLIGWDEILEGGLAPKAVVMSWRGEAGGIEAAKQKHTVIMTPGNPVYFDHTQSLNEDSVTIGGYNPLEKVYAYEPIPKELTGEAANYVLGAQANVWTEYMKNTRKVEYMIFPRISALSEVLWTPKEKRNWENFESKLPQQIKRYEKWKANYSRTYFDLRATVVPAPGFNGVLWKLETKKPGVGINYNKTLTAGDPPNPPAFTSYTAPLHVLESGDYNAWLVEKNRMQNIISQRFNFNKATGKKITLIYEPSSKYPGDGAFTLVNGVQNTRGLARSKEFIGFEGTNCEAIIDLGTETDISTIKVHSFELRPSWIWMPSGVLLASSVDGMYFTDLSFDTSIDSNNVVCALKQTVRTRYLKVLIKNHGTIPEGNAGAGDKAWLFLDEIEIE
jgi:hexosaminidase